MHSIANSLLKNINVLIVDDDLSLLNSIREFIGAYVKNIYVAKSGENGLIEFHSHDIDLVISDMHMSPLSGVYMVREIRRFIPDIPIIFTTVYDDESMFNSTILQSKNFLKKTI